MNNRFHHRSLGAFALGAAAMASMHCAHAELLVYEPFAYQSTPLDGQGGALGTTGTWTSWDTAVNANWAVYQEGAPSGIVLSGFNPSNDPEGPNPFDGTVDNLPTSGAFVGWNQGGNNMNADIGLDPSVTATFQPGSTTWVSYVSVRAWDRNEEHPNLVLATDPAPTGSRGDDAGGIGTGLSGFGTGGGPTRNNRTDIYPMFYNAGQYSNLNGAIPGNSYSQAAFEVLPSDGLVWQNLDANGDFGAPNIVIMKLEWDADTGGEDIISVASFLEEDTLSEAEFDAKIAATPNLSSDNWATTSKPNLDQTQLDTITFMGVKYFVDEIRIATSFDDVVGVGTGPGSTIRLAIAAATSPATGYDLEWDSTSSRVYDLRSSSTLLGDKTSWDLVSGGIAATPPVNTININPVDPELFYVVVGRPPPPVAIFSEDFDTTTAGSLPGGWDTSTNPGFPASSTNWEVGTPSVVGPVPPGVPLPSGTQCVGTEIDADYDDPITDDAVPFTDIWLRTPPIDLTGKSEGALSFQQWTEIEDVSGDLDYGSIRILDAFDDSELEVIENRTIDGSTTGWEDYSTSLPAAAFTAVNGTIRIEFRFEADDIDSFAGWYIDDVKVVVPAE